MLTLSLVQASHSKDWGRNSLSSPRSLRKEFGAELGTCTFIFSLHNHTVWVEGEFLHDRYLAPHTRYFIREMRIKAYTQLLESYRSLSLQHMAKSFGVSVGFIDK